MGELQRFTLDQLAAAAGMTPRNVRAYQTRGLISAPEREGRRSVYGRGHLRQLVAVRRARAEGATLGLISGVLSGGRSMPLARGLPRGTPPPDGLAPRRRTDLVQALGLDQATGPPQDRPLPAAGSGPRAVLAELAAAGAVLERGSRAMASADVAGGMASLQRLGLPAGDVLDLVVRASRAATPLADAARDALGGVSDRGVDEHAELVAGLLAAVLRDSLIAQLGGDIRR